MIIFDNIQHILYTNYQITEARQLPKVCARDLSKPWDHILRIWLLYRMVLATGLIENLARFTVCHDNLYLLINGPLVIK